MQDKGFFETPMNAVILYDEFVLAAHANAMLRRAAKRADAAVPWSITPRRVDMLMCWSSAADALHETAGAHLIVIAFRNLTEPPPGLLNWLEKWAAQREVQDAALAIFDDRNGDLLSAPPTPSLADFAERHGLCFIFGDLNPDEDETAASLSDLEEREMAITSTMAHLLEHTPRDSYRGWGIND